MYVVASDSRQISSVSSCFDCFGCKTICRRHVTTKKDAGLPVRVETKFPDHIFVGLGPPRRSHTDFKCGLT